MSNSATTVIYHSADFDGIFCREIARKFLPEAELIGWNFGDPPLGVRDGTVYVMDLSPDVFGALGIQKNGARWELVYDHVEVPIDLVWIDHHKTSIDKWPSDIPGYRIDGVAACRLAWQWFSLYANWDHRDIYPPYELPSKQDFVDRKVSEPLAILLAGEYDVWDGRSCDMEIGL